MNGAKRYQDLAAWRFCDELSRVIFDITDNGPASRDFDFQNQIRRAADAAPPMIAEGFVRFTTPEFVRYLRMARAELAEVQNRLTMGADKKYLSREQLHRAYPAANRAMGTTTNLLKSKLRQLEEEQRQRQEQKRLSPRRRKRSRT